MRDLIILGASVHAGEMVEIVERTNRVERTWNLLGFLATDEKRVGQRLNGYPIIGSREQLAEYRDVAFVPDNTWPRSSSVPREQLASLIDPSCYVSRTAEIGRGCVLYPNCFVGLYAKLGDYVFCLSGTIINHDDVIEDRVVLCSNVSLAGFVHLEPDCYLGQGCTVKQCLKIGQGSLIGMGAVVTKNVPPNSIMVGNPARRLRDREAKTREQGLNSEK